MSFPIGVPLEPNHYLQRFSRYLHPNIWVMTLTFLGHVTSSVTWPCHSPGVISYSCSIVTVSLSPTIFEIIGIFIYGSRPWPLWIMWHIVMWPIDPPYVISYWCPIVTEPLSLTVFEIFASKYIWVTTLTFLGHVTSSVTWPIDLPYVISYSYWCPIVSKPLSLIVFEIFGPHSHTHTHARRKWFY